MGWVRLDDGIFMHRKMVECSPAAKLLFIGGLTHSAAALTDGFITKAALRTIAAAVDVPQKVVKELVTHQLWHEEEGGWRIHDYLDYQPPADEERARRKAHADRMREWRDRRRDKSRDKSRDASRDGGVTTHVTPDVTDVCAPCDALPDPDPDPEPSSSSSCDLQPPGPTPDDDASLWTELAKDDLAAAVARGENIKRPEAYLAKVAADRRRRGDRDPQTSKPPPPKPLDEAEKIAAASRARARRADARARGEACAACEGAGVVLGDDDVAEVCQQCSGAAAAAVR